MNKDFKKLITNKNNGEYFHKERKGISEEIVKKISKIKKEPKWLRDFRIKALKIFLSKPIPKWGADLSKINFDEFIYYIKPLKKAAKKWEDLPKNIKKIWDKLGIPEAEKKFLAGVGAQYESETIYHNILKDLSLKGVVFVDPDTGLNPTEERIKEISKNLNIPIEITKKNLIRANRKFRKFFSTVVPIEDNKFSALNSAFFSGGSFIYVPKNIKLSMDMPLQAYFRINAESFGQFERTLIIADENSEVSYVEGCSAPIYSKKSLHAAVVEVIALKNSKVRYTTIQNWSTDIYNLVTKRAIAYENANVEWIDCNIGSAITMKYPSVYLIGKNSKADMLSMAYASEGQHQDAGNKVIHIAPKTSSRIISKSISKGGGRTTFRALIQVNEKADNCKISSQCDAIMLDKNSKSDTIPTIKVENNSSSLTHEAKAGKINEDVLFYLESRGLTEEESKTLVILGFINEISKSLPLEYAIELNKFIELDMEGSVG